MGHPIRVGLVTSQVTYIPDNYEDLFETLFQKHRDQIKVLYCLKNVNRDLLKTMALLRLGGVKNISKSLLRNTVCQVSDKRKTLCRKYGVRYELLETVNSPEYVHSVKKHDLDLIINIRTRFIYKKAALRAPRVASWNVHHGLLPDYRGTMCDLNALYEGREAGFSVHEMNEKIDDGKLIHVQPVSKGDKHYSQYLMKSANKEAEVIGHLLTEIKTTGQIPQGRPNHSDQVYFTRNPNKQRIREMQARGIQL